MTGNAHSPAEAALGVAARTAGKAPSIFNTQPWRWRIAGAEAELRADAGRKLDVIDPDGRLLLLSLGAALHHAVVTVAAEGWTPVVSRLPEPGAAARVRLGAYAPTDPQAHALRAAIDRRHTDRRAFAGPAVGDETLLRLRRAVEAQGCHLHVVRPEQVPALAAAVSRAAAEEQDDPAYRAELDTWTHRPAETGDGVPAATAVDTAARRVPMRDFAPDGDAGLDTDGHDAGATYVVVFGAGDDPDGWLRGGEALSALLLTATAEGVGASPLSEAMETTWPRQLLTELLGGVGTPYLVVRLGYPDPAAGPLPAAPRRDAAEVIEFVH